MLDGPWLGLCWLHNFIGRYYWAAWPLLLGSMRQEGALLLW